MALKDDLRRPLFITDVYCRGRRRHCMPPPIVTVRMPPLYGSQRYFLTTRYSSTQGLYDVVSVFRLPNSVTSCSLSVSRLPLLFRSPVLSSRVGHLLICACFLLFFSRTFCDVRRPSFSKRVHMTGFSRKGSSLVSDDTQWLNCKSKDGELYLHTVGIVGALVESCGSPLGVRYAV